MTETSKSNATFLGLDTMLLQTQEECAELIQAISKYNRTRGIGQKTETTGYDARCNLLAELADVSVCVEQLAFLLDAEEDVEDFKRIALGRVARRLERPL